MSLASAVTDAVANIRFYTVVIPQGPTRGF